MNNQDIKCVMFDFGNVIGIFDTARFYEALRKSRTITSIEPEELVCGVYNEPYIDFEKGEITDSEIYCFFQRTLGLRMDFAQFVHLLHSILYVDPKMVSFLRELKAEGIKLVLVSNLNEVHEATLYSAFPHVAPLFDMMIFSHRVGYRKPDPRMWLEPMRRMDLKPEECVFVDDMAVHVAEFRRLGGYAYHYAVTGENYIIDLSQIESHRKGFSEMLHGLGVF